MGTLDDDIRKAQTEDEQRAMHEAMDEAIDEAMNKIGKQASLWQMLAMAFRGKQAWMTWYMWTLGLVVMVAGIYSFIQFHDSADIKQSLSWMLAIQVCLSVIVIIKVLGWQQMQKLELMREIKHIELRQLLAARQTDS
jgi:N-acyl-D-aspartate/D-glutamate deacylase